MVPFGWQRFSTTDLRASVVVQAADDRSPHLLLLQVRTLETRRYYCCFIPIELSSFEIHEIQVCIVCIYSHIAHLSLLCHNIS